MNKFNTLALALTCALGLPSCLLVAGGAAGYVVSQEVLPGNVHTSIVLFDVDSTWASAQQTMRDKAEDGIETTDYPRRIECEVAGADVEVKVEVVGCKEEVKDLIYETRGRFVVLKDEDKDYIYKIIESYSRARKRS